MLTVAQVTQDQVEELCAMLREYLEWAFTLGDHIDAPTFSNVEDELRDLPGIFSPPLGRMLVATYDGKLAGCIAINPHPNGVCELKRFYVKPEFRGKGIGSALMKKFIEEARSIGYRKAILDSYYTMTDAHAAYRKVGFVDIEGPANFPPELKPKVVFMELDL